MARALIRRYRTVTAMLVVCGTLWLPASVGSAPDIQVLGLFNGSAVLQIDGTQVLLREGDTSPQGVQLLAANSNEAVLLVGGVERTLPLSDRVSAVFEKPLQLSVSIPRNARGQYRAAGTINGIPVSYLVDTGATIVAMNSAVASSLGLDYRGGQPGTATTAAGKVDSWRVVLDSITVGAIQRQRVDAVVIEGDYPTDVLLGMTFLSQVQLRETDGVLVLESNY